MRNKGNWMACDGFCSRMFHIECISLTESDLMSFMGRNVMWFCDECLPKFWEMKNRETVTTTSPPAESNESLDANISVEAQIVKLSADIANINQTVQNMISRSNACERQKKSNDVTTPHQSKLLCGTKENTPSFSNCSTSSPSCSASRYFWLYFTRIASFTTENDMRNLVRESLHYDGRIFVRKLVPPWEDPATMDYVSFKIGIVNTLKDMAMDSSTWPKGLRFREFITIENTIWEPSSPSE